MSHGHTGMALLRTGKLPSEWDYDLIGTSFYVVVATVDVANNRTAWRSGQRPRHRPLFERLSRARMIGVGAIPLLFALIASGFTLHAHQAISHTAPVIWCSFYDGSTPVKREDIPFTLVDFPAMVGVTVSSLPGICLSLVRGRNLARAVRPTAWSALIAAGTFSTLPILSIGPVAGMGAVKWVIYWVFAWGPFISSLFPANGFFPAYGKRSGGGPDRRSAGHFGCGSEAPGSSTKGLSENLGF
ncbi:hypothetical protein B0H17DRAFT_1147313 [Mycena rosella]|uniref:Uncharacterized protein n=1 Tax=Mycena rosella TaxID=1033263 RepID=A0AAD7CLZ5_MYCRO|nr:hypothetical protein B0H17DRAFT_1147313 [Mycena rosella]